MVAIDCVLVCYLNHITQTPLPPMPHQTLWLVRHGQRLDFVQPQWFTTATYAYDPPLSTYGCYQALLLAQELGQHPIEQILASPYYRALQTAQPLARKLKLQVQVEAGLREWLHPDWSPQLPELNPYWPHPIATDSGYYSCCYPQYPETAIALQYRAQDLASHLATALRESAVIFAHKHLLLALLASLTGLVVFPEQEWLPAQAIELRSATGTSGSWKVWPPSPGLGATPDRQS
jgi:broad specificity phosphatase PhoE